MQLAKARAPASVAFASSLWVGFGASARRVSGMHIRPEGG
jgi:hypothetical protein